MARRPRIFIGSSTSGLTYAEALHARLDEKCESTVWNHNVFHASKSTLNNLTDQAREVDFAALVLTPDDLVVKEGEQNPVARDNVLFEAGLFMGTLGQEQTFLVCSRDRAMTLPTDLAGITQARWGDRSDDNWDAALSVPARQILQAMKRVRERTATTEVVFDGRHRFDIGAWSVEEWDRAEGEVGANGNVLGIDRRNTDGKFVLWLDGDITMDEGGGERVRLRVQYEARALRGEHTLVLVFREADAQVGQHVWDVRKRVRGNRWQTIDAKRDVVLHGECRVRIEDRSVSAAPSTVEIRGLRITIERFRFDLDL
jgi:hypothetical protein